MQGEREREEFNNRKTPVIQTNAVNSEVHPCTLLLLAPTRPDIFSQDAGQMHSQTLERLRTFLRCPLWTGVQRLQLGAQSVTVQCRPHCLLA